MPLYRLKNFPSPIHMKGAKLPAPCAAHILVDRKDEPCMVWSEFLCDGPAAGRRGTCDRPLCEAHATQVGPNSHLCPSCRTEAIDEIGQRNLFTHLVQQ